MKKFYYLQFQELSNKMFKSKIQKVLVIINLVVWIFILGTFMTNEYLKKRDSELIQSHHKLVKLFNTFQNYEDYEKNIPDMETQMTKDVMDQVCPIIPEGFMEEFPKPKVTNLKTEKVTNESKNKKKLITSFSISLNNGTPFKQKTESVYQKKDDTWIMISYKLIF